MYYSFRVSKGQSLAHSFGYINSLLQWEFMFRGFLDESLDISSRQQRQHYVGLAFVVAKVIDVDDVWVVPEPTHRLNFALDSGPCCGVQLLRLDEGKSHVTVEHRVMGQVDLLLAALPQELLDLIASPGKGGGLR